MQPHRISWLILGLVFLGVVGTLGRLPMTASAADPVLVGAGDIATCTRTNDEATAALLDNIAGTVITLGDHAYPQGTQPYFDACYDPSWGRHKARTRPATGNHEYDIGSAEPYFSYFGAAAGPAPQGYYSYDIGAWHVVVLNSNCRYVGGCGKDSAQEQWLRADLAAHPTACTLAYWHHPRFTSTSSVGNGDNMEPIWQALYDYGADVVLSGHAHNYERFARQDPQGRADNLRGIRQFIVGTGGAGLHAIDGKLPTSEVRNDDTYGVLKLTLHSAAYSWQFIPVAGQTFTDAGNDTCSRPGSPPATPSPTSQRLYLPWISRQR